MVKAGQIYRHWKGHTAIVLAVANYARLDRTVSALFRQTLYRAHSTESDFSTLIFRGDDGSIIQNHDRNNPLVIYACSGKIWFRTLEEFTQVLGDTHDPLAGTMFDRFQLIADESKKSEISHDDRFGKTHD